MCSGSPLGLDDARGPCLAGKGRRAGVRGTSSGVPVTARGLNLDPPGIADWNKRAKEMVCNWSLLKTMGLLPCKTKYFVNEASRDGMSWSSFKVNSPRSW